jgi:hypothetical protein
MVVMSCAWARGDAALMGGMKMASNVGVLSRRNMLLGLGGATAAAGVVTVGTGAAGPFAEFLRPVAGGRSDAALYAAGYADWRTQVGTNFTAHSGQVLKLVDVQGFSNKGPRPSNLREQAFVARFDIGVGEALAEGVYTVAHPAGGTFDMFLTKGSPDKPLRMLAIFN